MVGAFSVCPLRYNVGPRLGGSSKTWCSFLGGPKSASRGSSIKKRWPRGGRAVHRIGTGATVHKVVNDHLFSFRFSRILS